MKVNTKETPELPEFYTAQEVAKMFRYSKTEKVYELCKDNNIPAFKIGRRWLIDAKGLQAFIRRRMGL